MSRGDVLQDLRTLHELTMSVAADGFSFDIRDRNDTPVYLPAFEAYEAQQRAAGLGPFAALMRASSGHT